MENKYYSPSLEGVSKAVDKILRLMQEEGVTQGEAALIPEMLSKRMQENSKAKEMSLPFTVFSTEQEKAGEPFTVFLPKRREE